MAVKATLALKAGVWFRRVRFVMISPDSRQPRCQCQAENPLIALSRFPEPALYQEVVAPSLTRKVVPSPRTARLLRRDGQDFTGCHVWRLRHARLAGIAGEPAQAIHSP